MTSVPMSSFTGSAPLSDLAYQAFLPPRTVFSVAPILFGLDKFANVLVPWPGYLAQWIDDLVPGSAQQAMYIVGVTEIVAGILVAAAPRLGGWLMAAWLADIIVNLLIFPGFFDIALRDVGMLVAAVVLTRLAARYPSESRRPFAS
ncbi:MAG: DoxX family membrane protein [Actinomycetota bacterium]|nr:DoxX family membrane protein [Actinomycetota bacterium]MDQ3901557.1 DoxX family membrane protein [Actinomycetota bacterium]